jgi:hypothetical protein
LAPIMKALPLNHHLRELNVDYNGMSEAFARKRLLPAVSANTALLVLNCDHVAVEAAELVRRRWLHG